MALENIDPRVADIVQEAMLDYGIDVDENIAETPSEREIFLAARLAALNCLDGNLLAALIRENFRLFAESHDNVDLVLFLNGMEFAFILHGLEKDLISLAAGEGDKDIEDIARDAVVVIKSAVEALARHDFCTAALLQDLFETALLNFIDALDGEYLPLSSYGQLYRVLTQKIFIPLLLQKWGLVDEESKES